MPHSETTHLESFNIYRGDELVNVEGEIRFIKENDFKKYKQDVIRLVIAARYVLDGGHTGNEFRELDQAVESFAERVPYEKD